MKRFRHSPIKAKISELSKLKNGQRVIIEGYVSYVAPTRLERLCNYIIVDIDSPVQRALYLLLDSYSTTMYVVESGWSVKVVDVPLGTFYEGMKVIILGKVIKKNKEVYVKFIKRLS